MLQHFQATGMWLVILCALLLVSVGAELVKHIFRDRLD